jgi:hypothetical protein
MELTNEQIFSLWSDYQESRGIPKPAYGWSAYTQDMIDMWKRILVKEGVIK